MTSIKTNPPWRFRAALSRPHDGDSFYVLVDLGFSARFEAELRLADVRAPEIHPMQPGGQESLDFVNEWLAAVQIAEPGRLWPLTVDVTATTTFEPGMDQSFTRYVATAWSYGADQDAGRSLNAEVNAFLAAHPEWPSGR